MKKIKRIVANSGAMEADTISKNGWSSKSLLSRGNFFKKTCFALFVVSSLFVSNKVQGQTARYTTVKSKMLEPIETNWEHRNEVITISKANVSGKSGFIIKVEKNGSLYSEYIVTYSGLTKDGKWYTYDGTCKILQIAGGYTHYSSMVLCSDKMGNLSEKRVNPNLEPNIILVYHNPNNKKEYLTQYVFNL